MALFKGEGGCVFEMNEPLPEVYADQLRQHKLIRVDSADSVEVAVQKPAKTEAKAEWVSFAVSHGDITRADAEHATKAELIERYG